MIYQVQSLPLSKKFNQLLFSDEDTFSDDASRCIGSVSTCENSPIKIDKKNDYLYVLDIVVPCKKLKKNMEQQCQKKEKNKTHKPLKLTILSPVYAFKSGNEIVHMNKKEDKEFSHSLTIPLPSNLVDISLNSLCLKLIFLIDKHDFKVTKSFMMIK